MIINSYRNLELEIKHFAISNKIIDSCKNNLYPKTF